MARKTNQKVENNLLRTANARLIEERDNLIEALEKTLNLAKTRGWHVALLYVAGILAAALVLYFGV